MVALSRVRNSTSLGETCQATPVDFSCLKTTKWHPSVPASIWFGVVHIGWYLCDTITLIPYEALGPEATPLYDERNSLYLWQEAFVVVGILFGAVIPGFMPNIGGAQCGENPTDGCTTYWILVIAFATLHLVGMLNLVYHWKEKPMELLEDDSPDIVPTIIQCFENKPFRLLIMAEFIEAVGYELPFVVLPYLTKWVIGTKTLSNGLLFSMLAGLNLVCRLLFLPLWRWVVNRVHKYCKCFACDIRKIGCEYHLT